MSTTNATATTTLLDLLTVENIKALRVPQHGRLTAFILNLQQNGTCAHENKEYTTANPKPAMAELLPLFVRVLPKGAYFQTENPTPKPHLELIHVCNMDGRLVLRSTLLKTWGAKDLNSKMTYQIEMGKGYCAELNGTEGVFIPDQVLRVELKPDGNSRGQKFSKPVFTWVDGQLSAEVQAALQELVASHLSDFYSDAVLQQAYEQAGQQVSYYYESIPAAAIVVQLGLPAPAVTTIALTGTEVADVKQ